MVELSTLLMVGLIGFGAGVLTTAVVVLLVVIYNNVKDDDDADESGFAIPLSALMGGGAPGRNPSMADIQAYAAKAAAAAGAAGQPEAPKATGGQYI